MIVEESHALQSWEYVNEVSEVRICSDDENIIAYLTNDMTLGVNKEDTIYSTHGTIFKFI